MGDLIAGRDQRIPPAMRVLSVSAQLRSPTSVRHVPRTETAGWSSTPKPLGVCAGSHDGLLEREPLDSSVDELEAEALVKRSLLDTPLGIET